MNICLICCSPKQGTELQSRSRYGACVCKKCHRKLYLKDYYAENKETIKQQSRKNGTQYRKTEKGIAARQRAQENYRKSEQYNLKQNARKKVLRAVKAGRLIKPKLCDVCRQEKELEAHHTDYNKPLEVDWLCKECHENTHHLNEGHESI